jgi:hypothetical protein
MLPFPDYYTIRDPSSPTGRRIDFKTAGMPANVLGTHSSAGAYNASDMGSARERRSWSRCPASKRSPTSATGAVPINHIGRYRKGNAPVVVIDATTGKRWPIWVEIDSLAGDPSKAALEIHPATNFAAGHRYIVALRNLRNAAGDNVPDREGADRHGAPRATPAEQQLVSDFFAGAIPKGDNCGGGPCYASGFSGP